MRLRSTSGCSLAGLLSLGGTLVAAFGWAPAGTAAAANSSAARSCVTVVVSGKHSCVAAGGTGIAVLKRAGHTVAYAPSYPGYVRQIDGNPRPCTNPTDDYWAYFHARPSGRWTYSSVGAASRKPAAGTCDGWRFETGGATTPPAYRCPAG